VHETQPSLRVAATPPFAEFAAGPLLHAFKQAHRNVDVELQVARRSEIADLLADRRADIALGPSVPSPEAGPDLDVEPFLRYGLVVVAAPRHTLAGSRGVAPAALVGTPWLLGPYEADPDSDTGAFLARQAIAGARTRTYPNFASAMAQTAAGRGVTLAIAHTIRCRPSSARRASRPCARSSARRRPPRRCSTARAACPRSASCTWAAGADGGPAPARPPSALLGLLRLEALELLKGAARVVLLELAVARRRAGAPVGGRLRPGHSEVRATGEQTGPAFGLLCGVGLGAHGDVSLICSLCGSVRDARGACTSDTMSVPEPFRITR